MPASVAEAVAAIIEANSTPSIPENAASPAPLGVYRRAKKAKWAQIKQLRDLLYETRAALRTKWRTNSNRTTTEQHQLASEHIRNARMIKDAVRQTVEELLELCRTVASYVAVAQNAFKVTCSYIAHSLTFNFLLYFYFWTYCSHPDLQVVSDDASTRTIDTVSESSYIGYSLDEEIYIMSRWKPIAPSRVAPSILLQMTNSSGLLSCFGTGAECFSSGCTGCHLFHTNSRKRTSNTNKESGVKCQFGRSVVFF